MTEKNEVEKDHLFKRRAKSSGLIGALVFGGLLAVGIGVFATLFIPDYLRRERQSDLAQNGSELASARILSVSETGRWYAKKPILQFLVQVSPANAPEFSAEFKQEIPLMQVGNFRVGAVVHLRYNSAKPNEFVIVNQQYICFLCTNYSALCNSTKKNGWHFYKEPTTEMIAALEPQSPHRGKIIWFKMQMVAFEFAMFIRNTMLQQVILHTPHLNPHKMKL